MSLIQFGGQYSDEYKLKTFTVKLNLLFSTYTILHIILYLQQYSIQFLHFNLLFLY